MSTPKSPAAPDEPGVDAPRRSDGVPDSWRWRLTSQFTVRSRHRRFQRFMELVQPESHHEVLDVGVIDTAWRSSNFFELLYPWRNRVTAVALEPMPSFREQFPEVRFVVADGRELPFADDTFDIGFSNAVVEHVGGRESQARFVAELLRTCRIVFIATPNARFPVDPHTMLPFVHWLPRRVRHLVLRVVRQGRWASESVLNPLSEGDLRSLFPSDLPVRIERQRLFGMTTVLTAIAGLPDQSSRR